MISLYVFIVSVAVFRVAGFMGVKRLGSINKCVRYGFAVMFVFAGISHFTPLKADFLRMIPIEPLRSESIVYLTGAMEIAGALWLVWGKYLKYACLYLILFLLAVLPANIYASINGITIAGNPPSELYFGVFIQFFYITLLAYLVPGKDHSDRLKEWFSQRWYPFGGR